MRGIIAALTGNGENIGEFPEVCDRVGIPYSMDGDNIVFSTETLNELGLSDDNEMKDLENRFSGF